MPNLPSLITDLQTDDETARAARGSWGAVVKGAWHGTNLYFLNGKVWHNDPHPVYPLIRAHATRGEGRRSDANAGRVEWMWESRLGMHPAIATNVKTVAVPAYKTVYKTVDAALISAMLRVLAFG